MTTFWATPQQTTFRGAACTALSWQVCRCAVYVWLLRDEPRAFIGGGEFGPDGPVRETDAVELEAL